MIFISNQSLEDDGSEQRPEDSETDEKSGRLARESKSKNKQSGHDLTHETTKKRTDTNVHSKNVKNSRPQAKSNSDGSSNSSNSNSQNNARRSTKKQSKSKQSKQFAKKRNASASLH